MPDCDWCNEPAVAYCRPSSCDDERCCQTYWVCLVDLETSREYDDRIWMPVPSPLLVQGGQSV